MKKISSLTATATSDGLFTNGSVASGVSPTILEAGWFNTIQNELVAVVQGGGLSLDDNNDAQVLAALKQLCLSRSNPFGDIAADGKNAIQTALTNLGLGNGSALPVGVPVPWPLATPPTGYLKCNGASFSGTAYPGLATAYPSLVLPDLRGEFIRGWDDGRGIDSGRGLLTLQEATWIQSNIENNSTMTAIVTGNVEREFNTGVTGAVSNLASAGSGGSRARQYIRPRNVAFNYIVRAA